MEAHGSGPLYASDRVKQALHLRTDRGSALREAAMAVRKAGPLAVVGIYGVINKFPLGVLMNKGITIRTAQQPGQRYMLRMLEHVHRGELDPSFLVTHRMSLEDAPRGYSMFKSNTTGACGPCSRRSRLRLRFFAPCPTWTRDRDSSPR